MKVGIIGAGNAGMAHLFAYNKIKGIESICISQEGNTCNNSKLPNCKTYTDYKQMIDENQLDVVSICTPPFSRVDEIKYAAEAGIDILCEPPMAKSYSEALEIKKIIERSNIKLMMGFALRFSKFYQDAKELIRDGKLGDVIFARWVYASCLPQNTWSLNAKEMRGIIFDKGCQIFDILCWFFDLPGTVDATFINKRKMDFEENAFVTLKHPSSISQLSLSYGTNVHQNRPMERIEIYGTACNLIIDHSLGIYSFLPASKHILSEYLLQIPKASIKLFLTRKNIIEKENPYLKEISYFINCIERNESATPNYIDGVNNAAIIDACYRSIKENGKIRVDV